MLKDKYRVIATDNSSARRLKQYPRTVSITATYADGYRGKWWINCPTINIAERIEGMLHERAIAEGDTTSNT